MEPTLLAVIAVAGSFLFVLLFSGILVLCRESSKLRSSCSQITSDIEAAPALDSLDRLRSSSLGATEDSNSVSYDPSLKMVSMSELIAATRNFAADGIIGDGSFGFVYKAQLSSGTVAVKRLSADAAHGVREFMAEMDTLGQICHPNLARLLGYCVAGRDRVLIYEYIERGSLDQWLHEPDAEGRLRRLPWPTRVLIIRGVAAGLLFLHEGCKPAVIHRDIKASNVLLGEGFEARIADFGLARRVEAPQTHVSTQAAGTIGYMAPEYREGGPATVKADVYSFGILMLEVATGRRPNLKVRRERGGREELGLAIWAREMVEEGRVAEILDEEMGEEGVVESEARGYLEVAFRCTEDRPGRRPAMAEAVASLKYVFVESNKK